MNDILSLHRKEYGVNPDVAVSAPGVVNLVGEHTDYNDGFVLQFGLNRRVQVAVSRRKDNSLRFYAADFQERKRTTLANLKYKREDRWANYVKGVIAEILKEGYKTKGLNFTIYGEIPIEIGLASSAALCTASTYALKRLLDLQLGDKECLEIAARAETSFIGVETTIADHVTSALTKKGHALFIDIRGLEYEYIPMNLEDSLILLTLSNVPKVSSTKEFAFRKEECKKCVQYLNERRPGNALRDYTASDLKHSMGLVPENTRRLCMHVVEENERVIEGKDALLKSDVIQFGKVLTKSHESLRDNFEVSCPEIDWLVKRACELEDVLGSRLTGSGFGGCTITLLRKKGLDAYQERLEEYERIFGFTAETVLCEASGGIEYLPVTGKK